MLNVMCQVSKITVNMDIHCGYMYMPDMNYPDMSKTIQFFTKIDPDIVHIHTFVDGKPDTQYIKLEDEWRSI